MRQSIPKLHSYRPKVGIVPEPPVPATAGCYMTVNQALHRALLNPPDTVLILGYTDGELYVVSSHQTRQESLWLVEYARNHILFPKD